jgi:general secretion pathway protein K
MVDAVRRARTATGEGSSTAPLMPLSVSQLGWLGLSPATIATLAPHVAVLPGPTLVNLNTADLDVLLAAIEGLDIAGAQKLMQVREARHFRNLEDVRTELDPAIAITSETHTVQSSYFEVRGRLRLGDVMVDERSMVRRLGREVTTLWRERGAFDRDPNHILAAPGR